VIIKKEIVAQFSYQVSAGSQDFSYKLEIEKSGSVFTGHVYRLEYYRLLATFPQNSEGAPLEQDDALVLIKDEFIDCTDLIGASQEQVVCAFEKNSTRFSI
jgi:hypothetical protein